MTQAAPKLNPRTAQIHRPVFTRLSLEEEVLSLQELAPGTLDQIPDLFAESVVTSAMKVLGETTGEALVRCIGDSRLKDPTEVYARLDSFLMSGSKGMKEAIVRAFSDRVHDLYRLTMEVAFESRRLSSSGPEPK